MIRIIHKFIGYGVGILVIQQVVINKYIKRMDLTQYKMFRSNNFPLPASKHQPKDKNKPQFISTYAFVSAYQPETYEVHINSKSQRQNYVVMFNDREYLKRGFNEAIKVQPKSNQHVYQKIINKIGQTVMQNDNNLIICNALDLQPIQEFVFPLQKHKEENSDGQSKTQTSLSALKVITTSLLSKKKNNTIATLAVLAIRADGTLNDELNYQWINENKQIEDLIKIKQRTKLKVGKYKSQIKTFDLNRQQVRNWEEAEEILYHYFQIKDYLQVWNEAENPGVSSKIGELYEICEIQVDQQNGYIKHLERRNCLIKFNQYMKESNLVIMKISQMLKEKVNNSDAIIGRDLPAIMFIKDFFNKGSHSHFTLVSQLGVCQSIKQQSIFLAMDLQVPKSYIYLKNYRDKLEVMKQVKNLAISYRPLTNEERSQIKISSLRTTFEKINIKSIKIVQQSEKVASKSFFFDTFSSNEKKNVNKLNTFQVQTVMDGNHSTLLGIYGTKQANNNSMELTLSRKQNQNMASK